MVNNINLKIESGVVMNKVKIKTVISKLMKYKIVLIILFFCLLPFISLFLGTKIRDFCFRELSYRVLYNKLTEGCVGDSVKIMKLYEFVIENSSVPPRSYKFKDVNPFEILKDGIGFCDQQANLLITLAGIGGIKGNLVFLYGYDSVSHHSVCELELNDKFRMFDPFYKMFFLTNSNTLASFNDIQNGKIKFPQNSSLLPREYFKLFEKQYPKKIFMTNNISTSKKVMRKITSIWYSIFGGVLLKPYIYSYFIFDNSNEINKKRIMKILD